MEGRIHSPPFYFAGIRERQEDNMLHICDILKMKEAKTAYYIGDERYKKNAFHYCVNIYGYDLPKEVKPGDILLVELAFEEGRFQEMLQNLSGKKCAGVIFFIEEDIEKAGFLIKKYVREAQFGCMIFSEGNLVRQTVEKIQILNQMSGANKIKTQGIVKRLLFGDNSSNILDWIYLLDISGVDVFEKYQVGIIKIEIEEENTLELEYEKIRVELSKIYSGLLFTVLEKNLVVVLPEKKDGIKVSDALKKIYVYAVGQLSADCRIAIGGAYAGLENVKNSFGEALRTLDMIDIVCSEEKVCTYDMLGIYQLVYELKNYDVCEKYFKQMFAPLWEYDDCNDTELFFTLEMYVKYEFNLIKTAEMLFIHKNTLRNRLVKIENILGKNLNNVNDITEIVTAFKVRRLTNVLKQNRQME